ncbi:MAG: hypothetical protein CMM48_13090 [Rhodospirillaceae bacterium]|nr:hypothetical protein [Rhodospirillaceae bacterium]
MTMTAELPAPITGAQAWRGPEMAARQDEWQHHWTADQIDELSHAAEALEDCPILEITKKDFPLPTVGPFLAEIAKEILFGRGFVMLRGLPIDDWSIEKTAAAYWGLGLHLGHPVSQNGKGHVLGHVKNLDLDPDGDTTRGYQTSDLLPFHTDTCDVVGLFCIKPGKAGGESLVVSSAAIFNEMSNRRPDLAAVLMQPLQRSFWRENPDNADHFVDVPLFMPGDERLISHYVRAGIHKAQELPGVRPFTEEQIEAIALFDSIADDPDFHLDMHFQPGDMQFLSNYSTLHSRRAFEDFEDFSERRHLLRLWLACPDGPPLPHWLVDAYDDGNAYGRPNAYNHPSIPLTAPLEAE